MQLGWNGCLPSQRFRQLMILALDLEYLDRLVGRTGREPSAIVIQYGIMLRSQSVCGHWAPEIVGELSRGERTIMSS